MFIFRRSTWESSHLACSEVLRNCAWTAWAPSRSWPARLKRRIRCRSKVPSSGWPSTPGFAVCDPFYANPLSHQARRLIALFRGWHDRWSFESVNLISSGLTWKFLERSCTRTARCVTHRNHPQTRQTVDSFPQSCTRSSSTLKWREASHKRIHRWRFLQNSRGSLQKAATSKCGRARDRSCVWSNSKHLAQFAPLLDQPGFPSITHLALIITALS